MCICPQVSLRSTTCPGKAGNNLQPKDFLFSRTLYAVTSIEASNQVWLEQLKGKDQVVRDFAARKKNLYPTQQFLDHGDTFDALVKDFESSKEDSSPLGHELRMRVSPPLCVRRAMR